ncbi:MAG: DJ-1/PfpI family protein [Devosia sp.]|uniref:DJ-1/PfpI family protein n=1 Tax=Devosia sp. TaxID=1871048 RepID=UPI0033909498
MLRVAIYLFDGVTALDAVGPFESLSRSPEIEVSFVGRQVGQVRTGNRALGLFVDHCIDDVEQADVLIVPGGGAPGLGEALADVKLHAWIRKIDATTRLTCSVCTGALILGAAGLLDRRRASTHWRARNALAGFSAIYSPDRVTHDGKYMTSAGVSAGIDLGLTVCGQLLGTELAEAIELSMQYDPTPPYGTGDPKRHATPERVRLVEDMLR